VTTATPSYKGHRYPVEIINHCVWLYFRFPLSFREVEELMLVRGVAVCYETIRRWSLRLRIDSEIIRFGRAAHQLDGALQCHTDIVQFRNIRIREL
jgi:transposase-like protein